MYWTGDKIKCQVSSLARRHRAGQRTTHGSMKLFVMTAALLAFIGVGAGAFGAHGLADFLRDSGREGTFDTAVRYQVYHALALFGVGLLRQFFPDNQFLSWSGWLFIAGTLIFSGSLYLLIFTGQRWLGAVTPLGGLAFLGGWLLLLLAVWRI